MGVFLSGLWFFSRNKSWASKLILDYNQMYEYTKSSEEKWWFKFCIFAKFAKLINGKCGKMLRLKGRAKRFWGVSISGTRKF